MILIVLFFLQILEVNGQSLLNIAHNKALDILKKPNHLSITVKSNLAKYKEVMGSNKNNVTLRNQDNVYDLSKKRHSVSEMPAISTTDKPLSQEKKSSYKKERSFMMTIAGTRPRVRKALRNILYRDMNR